MELTKQQIKFIDHRLENEGIKYWDIRIEMLDHIVSDIENRLKIGESYKSALENSIYSLGFDGNLESLNRRRLFGINKIVRKQYFTKIFELITKPKSILTISLLAFVYYLVFLNFSLQTFKIISFFVMGIPVLTGAFLHLKEFYQKRSSGYLLYGSFYIFFSILMLNVVIQFVRPDGIIPVSKQLHLWILFLITCLNSLFSFAGILVYLKFHKRIKLMKLKLVN